MSYDVSVGKFSANYTSNVWRMFHNHIRHGDKTGVQALDGLTGRAAGVILAYATTIPAASFALPTNSE